MLCRYNNYFLNYICVCMHMYKISFQADLKPHGPQHWGLFSSPSRYSAKLGEQMADLHLYNKENGEKLRKKEQTIGTV